MLWGVFCIKLLCFSKISFFQTFDWSNLFFNQSKLRLKFLVWVCLTRLMFDQFSIDRNWKIFSFYVFNQNFFSCIICVYDSHALHYFCIHLTVLQSYLSFFFTHNMHTLCYIGYSTWSKNWLINFWAMYFLVYAFFMCEL